MVKSRKNKNKFIFSSFEINSHTICYCFLLFSVCSNYHFLQLKWIDVLHFIFKTFLNCSEIYEQMTLNVTSNMIFIMLFLSTILYWLGILFSVLFSRKHTICKLWLQCPLINVIDALDFEFIIFNLNFVSSFTFVSFVRFWW